MSDRFGGTPDNAARGSTITVEFTNPDLANSTVTIQILDDNGNGSTLEIDLDQEGHGSVGWTIPEGTGDSVLMQHESSDDHTIAITG